MRRSQRLIATTVLAAMSIALAGCSSGNFDPTDMMDWLDTKKKLPGDRRPVFPEGVPGVEQGVPKDLYRGAQQQPDRPPVAEVPPPAPEPKARKSAARSVAPAAAPAEPDNATPESDEGVAAAPPAAPAPPPIKRKRSITAPPADPQPAQQQAQPRQAPPPPQQQSSSPFPAPLPSGGFAR